MDASDGQQSGVVTTRRRTPGRFPDVAVVVLVLVLVGGFGPVATTTTAAATVAERRPDDVVVRDRVRRPVVTAVDADTAATTALAGPAAVAAHALAADDAVGVQTPTVTSTARRERRAAAVGVHSAARPDRRRHQLGSRKETMNRLNLTLCTIKTLNRRRQSRRWYYYKHV